MSRPCLVIVADGRHSYDDRAFDVARAALRAGWQSRLVLLTTGTRTTTTTRADGLELTRVGIDGPVMTPKAVQLRALDDRIAVLRSRRLALERKGEGRRSPRRIAVVAATRRALDERARLTRSDTTDGDPVALAAAQVGRSADLAKDLLAGAAAVYAAGPHGLAVAATAGRTAIVYDPRPAHTAVEPALLAATSALLESVRPRLAALVSDGVVADPLADQVRGSVAELVVADDARADWSPLLALLARHVGVVPVTPAAVTSSVDPAAATDSPAVVLGVAPANFAGQGWAWGRAAEANLPEVRAEVVAGASALDFPADVSMTAEEAESLTWQLEQARRVLGSWTHVLSESVRPVLGQLNGSVISGDLAALNHAGAKVAVVCHGSDIRRPLWHRQIYPFSPFTDSWEQLDTLVSRTARNGSILRALTVPVFVSTPDLLDDVPFAQWLPVVVGDGDFEPADEPLQREVPVVLHLPSSPRFKGTDVIDAVGERLAAEGLIDYRSLREVPAREVPAQLREADVVVDHLVIGNYGVLACQAMAAGRVTVGHVHDRVRRRVPRDIPIVEADPATFEAVLRSTLDDRCAARAQAAQGPQFVRELHDGRASARVLASFLGR